MLLENQGIIFQQHRNLPENLSSKEFCQRAPNLPPNEDPPTSGLRVSVCSLSSLRPNEAAVWLSATFAQNICVFSFFVSIELLFPKVLDLDG